MPRIFEMDFTDLVRRVQNGDIRAFESLYSQTEVYFRGIAEKYVSDDDAEMVLQNTYVTIFEEISALSDPKDFISWGRKICMTEALSGLQARRFGRRSSFSVDDDDEGSDPSDTIVASDFYSGFNTRASLDRQESKRLIRTLVNELPRMQKISMLLCMEGMTNREIARELGIPQDTAASNLRYAKANIEESVQELESEGTELYGMEPFTFFVWLFKNYDDEISYAGSAYGMMPPQLASRISAAARNSMAESRDEMLQAAAKQQFEYEEPDDEASETSYEESYEEGYKDSSEDFYQDSYEETDEEVRGEPDKVPYDDVYDSYVEDFSDEYDDDYEEEVPRHHKRKRHVLRKVILVLLILVVIGCGGFAAYTYLGIGTGKTVDLTEYLTVEFSGYNSYASTEDAVIQVDEAFIEENTENVNEANGLTQSEAAEAVAELIAEAAEIEAVDGISNGDVLTVTINTESDAYEELMQYCTNVTAEEVQVSVSGLEYVDSVNPFETVEVTYSGTDGGSGTAAIADQSTEDYASAYSFSISPADGLSNGDTVTATVTLNDLTEDELAETYGIVLSQDTMTYTVSGLETAETFDASAYISLSVDENSQSGSGTAEIVLSGDESDDAYLVLSEYYTLEAELTGLSNGDTVTVTLTPNADESEISEAYGLLPEETTLTYTVDGFGSDLEDYIEVLNMFYDGLSSSWSSYEASYDFSSTWTTNGAGLSDAGYALVDIDGNGTLELIVSTVDDAGNALIRDLYTCEDGEIIHLLSSGEGMYYYCTESVFILGATSDSYAWSYYYYMIDTSLNTLVSLGATGTEEMSAFEITLFADYARS